MSLIFDRGWLSNSAYGGWLSRSPESIPWYSTTFIWYEFRGLSILDSWILLLRWVLLGLLMACLWRLRLLYLLVLLRLLSLLLCEPWLRLACDLPLLNDWRNLWSNVFIEATLDVTDPTTFVLFLVVPISSYVIAALPLIMKNILSPSYPFLYTYSPLLTFL